MTQKNMLSFSFLILVFFGGAYFVSAYREGSVSSTITCQSSNANCPWYAVYLTNNQVYFGHIASLKDDTLALADAHYAEAYQEPAQVAKSSKFAITQAPKQTFRVVRRGVDSMLASDHTLFINRASVLYWEKFSSDAEVVKLLEQSK